MKNSQLKSSNPCQLPVLLHKASMSFIKEMDFIGVPKFISINYPYKTPLVPSITL